MSRIHPWVRTASPFYQLGFIKSAEEPVRPARRQIIAASSSFWPTGAISGGSFSSGRLGGFDVDGDDFFEYNDDTENRLRQVAYDSGRVISLSHLG